MWLEMRGRFLRISRKKETHTPVLFFERAKTHSPLKDVPSHSPRHSLWGSLASVSARGNFSRPNSLSSVTDQTDCMPSRKRCEEEARKSQGRACDPYNTTGFQLPGPSSPLDSSNQPWKPPRGNFRRPLEGRPKVLVQVACPAMRRSGS